MTKKVADPEALTAASAHLRAALDLLDQRPDLSEARMAAIYVAQAMAISASPRAVPSRSKGLAPIADA